MTRPVDIPEDVYERAEIFCDANRHIEDDRELVARAFMAAGQGKPAVGVTHGQAKVLHFVRQFQSENRSVSPSYDEIAEAIGRSKSNVHDSLHRMEDRGILRLAPRARSITIVAGA